MKMSLKFVGIQKCLGWAIEVAHDNCRSWVKKSFVNQDIKTTVNEEGNLGGQLMTKIRTRR